MAPNQDLKGLVVCQVVGFYLMKRFEGINKHFYFGMNIVHKRWDRYHSCERISNQTEELHMF